MMRQCLVSVPERRQWTLLERRPSFPELESPPIEVAFLGAESGSKLAELGAEAVRPQSGRKCPARVYRHICPTARECEPEVATNCRAWRANCPDSSRIRPESTTLGPTSADFGQIRPRLGQI